jgi:phospholipid/cholesterol/gamma-HCH transport system ATP-binding protein
MSDDGPIIRLENVHKAFGRQTVLDGVSMEVPVGHTTVVIGTSGCGKSVLLKHMILLMRPDRGRVFFRGEEISSLSERKLGPIRQRVGFLFQHAALFDSMTVEQNVCFPLEQHGGIARSAWSQRCREVLAVVGLDGFQRRLPQDLSGGERKRVALARAIVLGPEVILYDEPTTGLDPVRADVINELILKLQALLGTTAVVVTHDMSSARKIGDRIMMLHQGRFIADVEPSELEDVDDEIVRRFVRGQAEEDDLRRLHVGRIAGSSPPTKKTETPDE